MPSSSTLIIAVRHSYNNSKEDKSPRAESHIARPDRLFPLLFCGGRERIQMVQNSQILGSAVC